MSMNPMPLAIQLGLASREHVQETGQKRRQGEAPSRGHCRLVGPSGEHISSQQAPPLTSPYPTLL